MENQTLIDNARCLQKEFAWFRQVLEVRFYLYFQQPTEYQHVGEVPPPDLDDDPSLYAKVVQHYQLSLAERLTLLLALAPHLAPQALDLFFTKNSLYDRGYTEFGGLVGQAHSGFLPTAETVLFLLAGDDLEQRLQLLSLFDEDHFFKRHNIVSLVAEKPGEPYLSSALKISQEYLTYFTSGRAYRPTYNTNFPAKRIETELDWNDLVLAPFVLHEVGELKAWIHHHETIRKDWGLGDRIKPGYRALFYGPPGTGKTLTASLLGKSTQLDVYRIDLSQVVSKYIGETEKNLAGIFDQAENKNWILFFDEADALFGKRTSTKDAHDRYANQEVAYLLQRIEDFPGLVILATNLKGNIDDAFARRFQNMIYFPMPDAAQRLQLWQNAFKGKVKLAPEVDLKQLAVEYEISGGGIVNVLRYASLAALRQDRTEIQLRDILQGVRKELRKEGKTG
ncbi:MAG: ATP-binding protein [Saprospiraceae bacterium]|nr:ATP-binding protein [Saprospiraceae bacterium]MCB0622819.1 ATP-binding protein [Saprospiraceae bacterium]MCB0676267.1 ATP-binding protein [Saprospiraceae bacterium]MCB0681794.1 ATP-binding protein [Saprospiraceae bacterium]